ncbi:hypothetical protein OJF2_02120 [Aquisphaera giovannonii]|uniref:Uncharacterized protein n=1 Tax=Aquisphaera giovannonii TaxID=406548 RepID=A0A5B9VV23_9BACT|nr:hypothetical protein [Aquisphaera giovannonii]QEH31747.1 hypothetical protein OJF2_02120 [Aquisphaera giovannonii]
MIRRTDRALRPRIDGLETRLVPSARPVVALAVARVPLAGAGQGTYHVAHDNRAADQPATVELSGVGRARLLGRVTISGTLLMGGFLAPGTPDISGTITVADGRGTLGLRVGGPGGSATIPGSRFRLDATLEGGTGAYRNLRGAGVARLSFGLATTAGVTPIGGGFQLVVTPRRAGHGPA